MKNNYLNVLLISGSWLLAGVLNYIYHPIMLQFLSLEEFGTFGSLVWIFNILGVIFLWIDLFLTKSYSSRIQNNSKVKYLFLYSLRILFFTGILSFFIFSLLSPFLSSYLKISENYLVLLSGITLIYWVMWVSVWALLKSMRAFHIISIQQILWPVIKLFLWVLLVYLGFEVAGALLAFIIAGIFPLLYGLWHLLKKLKTIQADGSSKSIQNELTEQKNEILQFFLMSFVFALYMNLDVIIAKNLFSPEMSGVYAAIGVLGKFLIFLLLSIETVYYGQIMEHHPKDIPTALLKNPLILISITVLGAIVFNIFLGKWILWILKPWLEEYSYVYILSLVYYGVLAYTSFAMKVLTWWKKYSVNWILLWIWVIFVVLIYTWGVSKISEYIHMLVGLWTITMIISLIALYYFYSHRNISYDEEILNVAKIK